MNSLRKTLSSSHKGASDDRERLMKTEKDDKKVKMSSNQYGSNFSMGKSSNIPYQRMQNEKDERKITAESNKYSLSFSFKRGK